MRIKGCDRWDFRQKQMGVLGDGVGSDWSSSSDTEVPSCSKACTKAYAQLHSQYDKLTDDFRKSQFDVISYQTGLESVEARLLVYKQNEYVFEENIKLLHIEVQLRDTALVTLRQKLEKAKQERDDLKLKPTSPIIEDWVSDSEDEFENKAPQIVPSFVQSFEQVKTPRHSVQPVETSIPAATPKPVSPKSNSSGKRKNRKACFVCQSVDHLIKDYDYHAKKMAQPSPMNYAHRGTHMQYASLTHTNPQKHMDPAAVLTQSKPVSITAVRPVVSAAVPKIKAPVVSAAQDKGVIDSGCSRHMTRNMSYLSDFEELNGGYVSFGELKFNLFSVSQMCDKKNSVLFVDTECLVLSLDFKLLDESQVLIRVPKENNMYNVNLKNIVPSGDLTCLFAKATIGENLWHRRLAHINFKTINKLVKSNFVRGLPIKVFVNDHTCVACKKGKQHRASCKTKPVSSADQPLYKLHMDLFRPTFVKILNKKNYCLVITDDYSRFTWNNDGDVAFDGKEHDFDAKKPESEVILYPSSSAQSRKQDDKTKKEAKGKSPVESFTGYRDLSTEFEDCSDNSSNEVNAAGTIVSTVGKNSFNSTNTFSVVGLSNEEPKRVRKALKDPNWIKVMQEELLQFKMQKVWVLVDLPHGKRAIGTKWVFRNKEDEKGIVVRNKARLVAQGHT
nr:putative ribonuclease H-like domain-containing protein [Tanacetum cinerariifolium]